jgi:hypothetical protein
MADTYQIDPTSANSFDGTSLSSASQIIINDNGSPVDLTVDGSPYANKIYTDSGAVDATITVADPSQATGFKHGDAGTLIMKIKIRANGAGVGVASATATMADAVLTSINHTIGTNGLANVVMTFRVPSTDGSTHPVIWS